MNMTQKQRNFLLLCGGLIVLYYIAGQVRQYQQQAAFYRQQAIRAQQLRAKAEAEAKARSEELKKATQKAAEAAAANAPKPTVPPVLTVKLPGLWRGRSAMMGLGICDLRLELRENAPGNYRGYSNFSCQPIPSLMPVQERFKQKPAILSRMTPDAAILAGSAAEDGSIHLRAEKTVGSDIHGCTVTTFTLTPFGSAQLAAEWEELGCGNGRMILARTMQPGEKK